MKKSILFTAIFMLSNLLFVSCTDPDEDFYQDNIQTEFTTDSGGEGTEPPPPPPPPPPTDG